MLECKGLRDQCFIFYQWEGIHSTQIPFCNRIWCFDLPYSGHFVVSHSSGPYLSTDMMCQFKLWYQLVLSWESNEDNLKQSKGVYYKCKTTCQENWCIFSHCNSLLCKEEKNLKNLFVKCTEMGLFKSSYWSSLSSLLVYKVSIKEQKL